MSHQVFPQGPTRFLPRSMPLAQLYVVGLGFFGGRRRPRQRRKKVHIGCLP
jgi:hypothetical protein